MYSSVISNAVRKNAFERIGTNLATNSLATAGGILAGKRSGTVSSINDGKVTVGLSTSSSMRSNAELPHLVPQRTNVLTGASTQYFSNQAQQWKRNYEDLVAFQKWKVKRETVAVDNKLR